MRRVYFLINLDLMQENIRILAICGSTRKQSFNSRLLAYCIELIQQQNMPVTLLQLQDYPLPLYNGDLEEAEGIPQSALAIKQLMREHQGFLIASPEYNGSITPMLKNVLDWASRAEPEEAPLSSYRGKTAALISASPGALGGLRAMVHLRDIMKNLGCITIPEQLNLGSAHKAFDNQGTLLDGTQNQRAQMLCEKLIEITRKLN